jgi:hypothetical protein
VIFENDSPAYQTDQSQPETNAQWFHGSILYNRERRQEAREDHRVPAAFGVLQRRRVSRTVRYALWNAP